VVIWAAAIVNGGGDRVGKVQFSELHRCRNLDLDLESGHTAYHCVWYAVRPVCICQMSLKLEKLFLEGLTAETPPSSRSRDTKTRTNLKNLAGSNLDIVL